MLRRATLADESPRPRTPCATYPRASRAVRGLAGAGVHTDDSEHVKVADGVQVPTNSDDDTTDNTRHARVARGVQGLDISLAKVARRKPLVFLDCTD